MQKCGFEDFDLESLTEKERIRVNNCMLGIKEEKGPGQNLERKFVAWYIQEWDKVTKKLKKYF